MAHPQRKPRLKDIVQATCEITGTRHRDLVGPRRYRDLVIPRQMISYIAQEHGYSTGLVGAALNRDHATIHHSADAMRLRLAGSCGNTPEIIEAIRARAAELTAQDTALWTNVASNLAAAAGEGAQQ